MPIFPEVVLFLAQIQVSNRLSEIDHSSSSMESYFMAEHPVLSKLYTPGLEQISAGDGGMRNMHTNKAGNVGNTVVMHPRFVSKSGSDTAASHPNQPLESPIPGDRMGPYLLISRLGGGGMGEVYRAQDTVLDRPVALKCLPAGKNRDTYHREHLKTEANTHALVNHPHIISLYGAFESSPHGLVMVMEHVEGETLAQRLYRTGSLSLEETLLLFDQILTGVEHIHLAGIVHGDLKPSNLLLSQNYGAKIMDFGISMRIQEQTTGIQTLRGTLLYIPPEQISGHGIDFRSDIYTLGMTLYETVTGRLPFEERRNYALMHAHVTQTPARPSRFQKELPRWLERIILKAIEKEPYKRFQTAKEFRLALMKGHLKRRRRLNFRRRARSRDHYLYEPYRYQNEATSKRPRRNLLVDLLMLTAIGLMVFSFGMYPKTLPFGFGDQSAAPAVKAKYQVLQKAWQHKD